MSGSRFTSFVRYILALLMLFSVSETMAQKTNLSAFSKLGIGEIYQMGTAQHYGMGGVTSSIDFPVQVNFSNPASYAHASRPVFDAGIQTLLTSTTVPGDELSQSTTLVNNFSFLFPIKERDLGVSFGMTPYSTIGYLFDTEETLPEIGRVNYRYQGSGGLNRVYLGLGKTLVNLNDSAKVTIGVNGSYIFGEVYHEKAVIFESNDYFGSVMENYSYVNGVSFDIGFQARTHITKGMTHLKRKKEDEDEERDENVKNKHRVIGIGGTFTAPRSFQRDFEYVARSMRGQTFLMKDTIDFYASPDGQMDMPLMFQGGIHFEAKDSLDRRYLIALDYRAEQWTDFSQTITHSSLQGSFVDAYRIGVGFQYTPYTGISGKQGALKRTDYKIGAKHQVFPYSFENTEITETGITFGLSIPLMRSGSMSRFTIGADIGERVSDGLSIRENYARFYFSLTLTPHAMNRWFYQRKYE